MELPRNGRVVMVKTVSQWIERCLSCCVCLANLCGGVWWGGGLTLWGTHGEHWHVCSARHSAAVSACVWHTSVGQENHGKSLLESSVPWILTPPPPMRTHCQGFYSTDCLGVTEPAVFEVCASSVPLHPLWIRPLFWWEWGQNCTPTRS